MAHKLLLLLIASTLGVCFLLIATNPERLPAAVFVVFFGLLYGMVYAMINLCGIALKRADIISWSMGRITRTALAVACLPIFLLILQSIGQLTIKDVLLAVGLFVLLYAYFSRVMAQGSSK